MSVKRRSIRRSNSTQIANLFPIIGIQTGLMATLYVYSQTANMALLLVLAFTIIATSVVSVYGWLRSQDQRHRFLLDREKIYLARREMELQWQERQQVSHDLQLGLSEQDPQASVQYRNRASVPRRRKPVSPALKVIARGEQKTVPIDIDSTATSPERRPLD
jgi:hypothetical protein